MFNEYALVICVRVDSMIDDSSTKGLSQNPPAKHYKLNSEDNVSVPPTVEEPHAGLIASQASYVRKHQEILVIQISKTTRYRFLSILEAREAG
jgi:hypothetical protein